MSDIQKFYYKWNKNNKLTMYMVNTREKRYCEIPYEYEGLYKHLYGCQLDNSITLESIIERYNLEKVELDNING